MAKYKTLNNIMGSVILTIGRVINNKKNKSELDNKLVNNINLNIDLENDIDSKLDKEKVINLKNYYLKELAVVQANMIDISDDISSNQHVKSLLSNYKMWDKSLNSIYKEIKKNISSQKLSQLEEDQAKWKLEQNARDMQITSQSGSEAFLNTAKYLNRSTRERCYYLVNTYL